MRRNPSNPIHSKCGLWVPFPDVTNCAKFAPTVSGQGRKLNVAIDLRGDFYNMNLIEFDFILYIDSDEDDSSTSNGNSDDSGTVMRIYVALFSYFRIIRCDVHYTLCLRKSFHL